MGYVVFFNSNHTSGKYVVGYTEYYWDKTPDGINVSVDTPSGRNINVENMTIRKEIVRAIRIAETGCRYAV